MMMNIISIRALKIRLKIFLVISISLSVVLLSCKEDSPIGPTISRPKIETDSAYNEPYRDSIIASTLQGIVIMHKSGSGLRRISTLNGLGYPTWSPKKWKILYANKSGLYIMNADGSQPQRWSLEGGSLGYAVCSPDGEKIAYIAYDSTSLHSSKGWIKMIYADGTGAVTLSPLVDIPVQVTWAHDSQALYFDGQDSSSYLYKVFKISIDGTGFQTVYSSIICRGVALSPDGTLLAFSDWNGTSSKIRILNIQTRQLRWLTTGDWFDEDPSWSPDGQSIVYQSAQPDGGQWLGAMLWTINLNKSGNIQCTSSSLEVCNPCWK
jgi:Tol biopolymer transport system component